MARSKRIVLDSLPPEAFDRIPRVQVTLTDESAWLTRFDAAGRPVSTYPVAAAGLAAAFNHFGSDTGLLPPDTLFWQKRGDGLRIGVWLPPAVRELAFERGRRAPLRLAVPLPGLVFVGQGKRYAVFAAPERPGSGRAPLYLAPLPNVHASGGVCAGTVAFPRCAPDTIGKAAALFFESLFNADLSADKVALRKGEPDGLLRFLESLQSRRHFPNERLLPSARPRTLDELLNQREMGHG